MKKKIFFLSVAIFVILLVFIFLSLNKARILIKQKLGGWSSFAGLLAQARDLESKGHFSGALSVYQRLVNDFSNSTEVMNWQKKIEDLNIKLLFSPTVTPKSISYEIRPADTLAKIAKEFNTTVELLKKSNNLIDDKILPGRKIKVWTVPFTILIDKSQNILYLKSNEEIIKTYVVSTGINNSTPCGTFKIVEKLVNPTWFKATAVIPPGSPENVLGTRWLGFNLPGYGIHGTNDSQTLGKQVTQGCVRMANPDVEELYIIVPKGTEVTIID
jgi:lipoprotein-anchoring transpeptidase ErfK/SrfK